MINITKLNNHTIIKIFNDCIVNFDKESISYKTLNKYNFVNDDKIDIDSIGEYDKELKDIVVKILLEGFIWKYDSEVFNEYLTEEEFLNQTDTTKDNVYNKSLNYYGIMKKNIYKFGGDYDDYFINTSIKMILENGIDFNEDVTESLKLNGILE